MTLKPFHPAHPALPQVEEQLRIGWWIHLYNLTYLGYIETSRGNICDEENRGHGRIGKGGKILSRN